MSQETIPGYLVDELSDADADAVIRQSWPARRQHVWPACCGLCEQGRTLCVTPEACQMTASEEEMRSTEAMGWLLLYAVSVVVAIALLVAVSQ